MYQLLAALALWTGEVDRGTLPQLAQAGASAPKPDSVEALVLLAESGDPAAMTRLGVAYAKGVGVARNPDEATRWLRMAANRGVGSNGGAPAAMYNMGQAYRLGDGVVQDTQEALRWYGEAAMYGEPHALFTLGVMAEDGEGQPKSDKDALSWYLEAASKGDVSAMVNVGTMLAAGRGISVFPADLQPSVKAQGPAMAARWFRMAADKDSPDAMFNLAVLYEHGLGVKKDLVQSRRWFDAAREAKTVKPKP